MSTEKQRFEKDRKYLYWNNSRGIAWIHSRGYRWFMDRYLPAVSRVEKAGFKKDQLLLTVSYYWIGDVHDFNGCPLAAIKAYKRSFEIWDLHSEALRELGGMYEDIGQYKNAVSALKKSVKMNPADKNAVGDYEGALESLKYGGTSLYEKGDICWQGRECLAKNKPKAALRLLKNRRSIPARQVMACAYGQLGDVEGVVDQWNRIGRGKGEIDVDRIDWFYIGDVLEDNAELCEILARCARDNRFMHLSIWSTFSSLYETVVPFPARRRMMYSKADRQRCNKRIFLMTQYNIARIRRDRVLAQKIFDRYPNWVEMGELLEKLKR